MKNRILGLILVFSFAFAINVYDVTANIANDEVSINQDANQHSVDVTTQNRDSIQSQTIYTSKFVFEYVPNQYINNLFNVKVYAYKFGVIDTTYNQSVTIEYCCGNLSGTKSIKFVNGIGTFNNLKITSGAANYAKLAVFESGYSRVKSYSNTFTVNRINNTDIGRGNLSGSVYDLLRNAVQYATIILYNENNGNIITTQADKNGRYKIDKIEPGVYKLYAEYSNKKSNELYVHIRENSSYVERITINMCRTSVTPVILIPGITGSTISTNISNVIPILPENNSELINWKNFINVNSMYGLHDPYYSVGWSKLINTMTNSKNKYTIGCNVYPMPYDWRLHPENIVDNYLIPWINEIKKRTNTHKVNIVAHSMGGLIARAYIQGNKYNNDVDKLIMVGTPQYGSVNTYYLFDGGDPEKIDAILNILNSNLFPSYTRNFYRDLTNQMYFLYYNRYPNNNIEKRNFYNTHIQSLSVLMPTFPFIRYNTVTPSTLQCTFNNWLDTLNAPANVSKLNNVNSSIIIGAGYNTLFNIITSDPPDCNRSTYKEGNPKVGNENRILMTGDSTVPTSQAILPNIRTITLNASHAGLIKGGINDILYILQNQLKRNVLSSDAYNDTENKQLQPKFNQLNVLINTNSINIDKGNINIILPGGKVIDIYDVIMNNNRNIDNIYVDIINNVIIINIQSPENGNYNIKLSQNTNVVISHIKEDKTTDVSKENINDIYLDIAGDDMHVY